MMIEDKSGFIIQFCYSIPDQVHYVKFWSAVPRRNIFHGYYCIINGYLYWHGVTYDIWVKDLFGEQELKNIFEALLNKAPLEDLELTYDCLPDLNNYDCT